MGSSLGDDQTSATPLPTHNNLRQAGGFATPSSERVCFYTRIHSRVDRIYADATGHIPGGRSHVAACVAVAGAENVDLSAAVAVLPIPTSRPRLRKKTAVFPMSPASSVQRSLMLPATAGSCAIRASLAKSCCRPASNTGQLMSAMGRNQTFAIR